MPGTVDDGDWKHELFPQDRPKDRQPAVSRRRVLVTRALRGGSALAEQLHALGLEPVLVPVIETAPPVSYTALDEALRDLHRFHWVVFTSANGAECFARRQQQLSSDTHWPAGLKVAGVGPATERALGSAGIPVSLVPPQAVAESLAASLLPHVRQGDGTPTRFLLIRPEDAREVLPEALQAAGAEVTQAPAYRTVIPAGSLEQIRDILGEPSKRPHAVTFTSSSTVRNLLSLCESAGVDFPESMLRASIGPITSQTLREYHLPPHVEAEQASVEALARAVLEALDQQNGKAGA